VRILPWGALCEEDEEELLARGRQVADVYGAVRWGCTEMSSRRKGGRDRTFCPRAGGFEAIAGAS